MDILHSIVSSVVNYPGFQILESTAITLVAFALLARILHQSLTAIDWLLAEEEATPNPATDDGDGDQ